MGYETEMVLVILVADLWQERDGGSVSILGLLDLSVAFNTIDHCLGQLQSLGLGGELLHLLGFFV